MNVVDHTHIWYFLSFFFFFAVCLPIKYKIRLVKKFKFSKSKEYLLFKKVMGLGHLSPSQSGVIIMLDNRANINVYNKQNKKCSKIIS